MTNVLDRLQESKHGLEEILNMEGSESEKVRKAWEWMRRTSMIFADWGESKDFNFLEDGFRQDLDHWCELTATKRYVDDEISEGFGVLFKEFLFIMMMLNIFYRDILKFSTYIFPHKEDHEGISLIQKSMARGGSLDFASVLSDLLKNSNRLLKSMVARADSFNEKHFCEVGEWDEVLGVQAATKH